MATSTLKTIVEVESIAPRATLYRIGRIRMLVLNEYVGASNTLHVENKDAPSISVSAPTVVRDSNGRGIRLGQATVSATSPYYVHRYYAGTYNAPGEGFSVVSASDMTSAVLVWSV